MLKPEPYLNDVLIWQAEIPVYTRKSPPPEKPLTLATVTPTRPADNKTADAAAAKATAKSPDAAPVKAPSLKERAQAMERGGGGGGAAEPERGASPPAPQPGGSTGLTPRQPVAKDPPVRERSTAPAPPPASKEEPPKSKPAAEPAEEVDDESILVLPDGRQVEAKKVEQVCS